MPRKTEYSRNDIIRSALKYVEQNGFNKLTARTAGKKLGASTQPVYSQFSNIQELQREVLAKIVRIIDNYINRPYSNNKFINTGVGIIKFANDKPVFYKTFFSQKHQFSDIYDEFETGLWKEIDADERFEEVGFQGKMRYIRKMMMIIHGCAFMIKNGIINNPTDRELAKILQDAEETFLNNLVEK